MIFVFVLASHLWIISWDNGDPPQLTHRKDEISAPSRGTSRSIKSMVGTKKTQTARHQIVLHHYRFHRADMRAEAQFFSYNHPLSPVNVFHNGSVPKTKRRKHKHMTTHRKSERPRCDGGKCVEKGSASEYCFTGVKRPMI